jgi:hypothetical protein
VEVHLSIYLKQEVWLELGPKGNSSAAGESQGGVQRSEEGEVRDKRILSHVRRIIEISDSEELAYDMCEIPKKKLICWAYIKAARK